MEKDMQFIIEVEQDYIADFFDLIEDGYNDIEEAI